MEDQFAQIDARRVVEEMAPELDRVSKKIIEEVMTTQAQPLWFALPYQVKDQLYLSVAEDLPLTVEDLMKEIKVNIDDLFDLRGMVISTLLKDKQFVK